MAKNKTQVIQIRSDQEKHLISTSKAICVICVICLIIHDVILLRRLSIFYHFALVWIIFGLLVHFHIRFTMLMIEELIDCISNEKRHNVLLL